MNVHAIRAIYTFELSRTWRTLFQSIASPVLSTSLYFIVFGSAIGSRMQTVDGVSYGAYIVPGLIAMIQLFNGMQSSLSMVYDREMGSMRVLMITPLPRGFLLVSRLFAGVAVSLLQVYIFLLIAYAFEIELPPFGYLAAMPAMILTGMMLGALGMLLSSTIKQLENFAGIMNFVIFPMFFASSALYPLWKIQESSLILYQICSWNPFTYAVELIRFALYLEINVTALLVIIGAFLVFLSAAILAYDPSKGIQYRKAVAN